MQNTIILITMLAFMLAPSLLFYSERENLKEHINLSGGMF